MPHIDSKLNPRSEDFRANAAAMGALVDDLRTIVRTTLPAESLDYGVLTGDPERLGAAILTVVYGHDDGRPVAFNALSIMECELRGKPADVLHLAALDERAVLPSIVEPPLVLPPVRQVRVIYGPHGAPEYFTERYMQTFFDTHWEVHFNSSRTGVRLIGPKPEWARQDGGEAGLHPSNIHDNAYAIGAIDFTGDMPVILGPDGPSLGGFVCPATIVQAELWKMGQLKAGDSVRFRRLTQAEAAALEQAQDALRSMRACS